jgi:hypothetical protein
MSASSPSTAVVISDDEYSTDYSSDSDSDSESTIEVQAYLDEIHEAHEDLVRAQRRFNRLAGIDPQGDAVMPDAPPPPVPVATDMEGVEQSPPEPPAHYFNGFLQVLGANGFYHQTRYLFTTQAAHLFCLPPP